MPDELRQRVLTGFLKERVECECAGALSYFSEPVVVNIEVMSEYRACGYYAEQIEKHGLPVAVDEFMTMILDLADSFDFPVDTAGARTALHLAPSWANSRDAPPVLMVPDPSPEPLLEAPAEPDSGAKFLDADPGPPQEPRESIASRPATRAVIARNGSAVPQLDETPEEREARPRLRSVTEADSAVSVERFTMGKGIVPALLGGWLEQHTPFASGGTELYVWRNGAYRPHGRADAFARIRTALGPSWNKTAALDAVTWLEHGAGELDESPPLHSINVRNGILDLATLTLGSHDSEYRSPVQLAVSYNPDATCQRIDQFLAEVLPDDGTVGLVHEIIGLLSVPDRSFQKAVMLLGPSGTGKSTLLSIITAMLGQDNVSTVALHALEDDKFAVASLYGRLANVFADLPAYSGRSASIFKSIVGGDRIQGERKHRDPFTFSPYARLIFSANETPSTSDSNAAYFDRWIVVPMTRKFRGTPNEQRNLADSATSQQELSGLFNHALAGLARLRERGGFASTEATTGAGERYARDADSVAAFIEDRCIADRDAKTPMAELYQRYRAWCEQQGRSHPFSASRFNNRLEELFAQRGQPLTLRSKVQGQMYAKGIGLDG